MMFTQTSFKFRLVCNNIGLSIPEEIINSIKAMHEGAECAGRTDDGLSDGFTVETGVK